MHPSSTAVQPPIPRVLQHLPRRTARRFNGCEPWRGALDQNGYGRRKVNGRQRYAHREAYRAFWGGLGRYERVYHTCGRRDCTNPFHLTTDRSEASFPQEQRGAKKLSWSDVFEIRELWAEPDRPTQREIAERYGVSRSTISRVVRHETWSA